MRDEPAAEHTIQLGHPRGDAGRLLDTDVRKFLQRAGSSRRPPARPGGGLLSRQLLGKRAEGAAPGALAEPATRGGAALGAGELNNDLCHGDIVRPAPDGLLSFQRTI